VGNKEPLDCGFIDMSFMQSMDASYDDRFARSPEWIYDFSRWTGGEQW
jgi:hypothetical protein